MDPIAHTLIGASLAESGLKRLTPLATVALVLAANAPDIDAVTYLIDSDVSLGARRGWTHGILAAAVLPLVVALVVFGAARLWRRPASAMPRLSLLMGLAYVAFLTHPLFDWVNSYGVRLLMPFSGRWFYGDAVFVIDPWLWLIAGAAAFLAWSRGAVGSVLLIVLFAGMAAAVWFAPQTTTWARFTWAVGIVLLVLLRIATRGRDWTGAVERIAQIALGLLAVYAAAMLVLTTVARREAAAWLTRNGVAATTVDALPIPGNPLVRDVIAQDRARYYFVAVDWLATPRLQESSPPLEKNGPTPVTEAAMASPTVAGLRTWLRYPSYDVTETPEGYRVVVRDARFWRSNFARGRGLGIGVVALDKNLQPVHDRALGGDD